MGAIGSDWLQFLARWIHLIAGISWIGNSFYFMWLDASIPRERPQNAPPYLEGELWMVHGGGYYRVEKQKIRPGALPKVLHWFRWEATFTWLSGFVLLVLLYYTSDAVYLIDPAIAPLSPRKAVGISLGLLSLSWFVYDALWQSPIGKFKALGTALSIGLALGLTHYLTHTFSGRGAYLHLGAIFATLMVLNVWIRILPNQRRMIEASERGEVPDYEMGRRAKIRSTHNSYLTLPVLFTMVSNHLPQAYGHSQSGVILLLLCVLGGLVRHMMLQWNVEKTGAWLLLPITLLVGALIWITSPRQKEPERGPVSFSQVRAVVESRCVSCHSLHPTDSTFPPPAGGVSFDDPQAMHRYADRIKVRAVVTKTMPFANKTHITDSERELLGAWVDQGAKIQ